MIAFNERAAILWAEGFLCTTEDRHNVELVEKRWILRETVPQIGAKRAKEIARERSRFQSESTVDSD